MDRATAVRNSLLIATGCLFGLLILALAPTLLQQTSFTHKNSIVTHVRLIPQQDEELIESEEVESEPEPPPEPEMLPDLLEIEPPEIEFVEIEPPQTTYDTTVGNFSSGVQLPNLTGLELKGVHVGAATFSKPLAKAPLPGLPKHGPPRTRFNSDEVDKQPRGVATMQPIYPYHAKRLGIEGHALIRFLVNTSGKTDLFEILDAKPPGEFEKTVEKTVKRWRFKPAMKEGQPVETWVETTIEFKLR